MLQLPLEGEARSELWRLALQQQQPEACQVRLLVALARHCGHGASQAAAEGRWGVMQRELQEAYGHYQEIVQCNRESTESVQEELSNLLGKLISDLHAVVHADPAPELAERADCCWMGYELALRYRAVRGAPPEWLSLLEEQLVRQGTIDRRQQLSQPEASTTAQQSTWQAQALDLLLHLGKLHNPCPEWISLAAREHLQDEVETLLQALPAAAEANGASSLPSQQLQGVSRKLARLPMETEQRAGVHLAVQRAMWSLQLLEQKERPKPLIQASASPQPQPQPASPAPTAKPAQRPQQQVAATPRDPRQLYKAIGLGVKRWLEDHPRSSASKRIPLRPVLQPGQAVVMGDSQQLALNLAPLLQFPTPELLDELVPAFFTPLRDAGRGAEFSLAEPCSQLWQELRQRWAEGERLRPDDWHGLTYSTALWSRCGGTGELNAKPASWTLPVASIQAGSSLLRPGNVELAALQTVVQAPGDLDELLAEIRRRHHDRAWMETKRDHWWFDPSDGSENLRRLHTNAGFYASSHAPLESLRRWSQGTLRALMSGPVLFGNSSITQMFWPIAQALLQQTGTMPELVQWPGEQAFYDAIADQEVLFVTPFARDVEVHHRSGKAFQLFKDIRTRPYGLRCLEAPVSVYPNRPGRGFEESLNQLLEQIERSYKQKPFSVFTAASGCYGLPLCEAVKQRYGVTCLYIGNLMHAYFGLLQRTTATWRAEQRIEENWHQSHALDGMPGINRIEDGRYLTAP